MSKNTCVIYAPVETYSGYGARSRGFIKALIDTKGEEWDIKIISCRWGNTPQGFLDDHKDEWGFLKERIITQLTSQPDYMFWVTVPNEVQPVGKWNCVVTAGIETTICSPHWIEGCNRADLVLTSSTHSKNVFKNSTFEMRDEQNLRPPVQLSLEKPIEVLLEEVNLSTFKPLKSGEFKELKLKSDLNSIPEDFAFLFVGHWMQGELGEDRKNVGLLVKAFYEVFKKRKHKPALILKVCGAGSSYMDRREIERKIDLIKSSVVGNGHPNVYVLHGEFTDHEMNEIYNHPKVKSMISLTKGEGFGRPLLEFSSLNKPIICSNWSGPIDFLQPEYCALLGGTLKPIHPSAQVKDMLLERSQWFSPDSNHIGHFMIDVHKHYKDWETKARKQGKHTRENFSYDKMKEKLKELLDKYAPKMAKQTELKLPQLKKIELPKLKKIE